MIPSGWLETITQRCSRNVPEAQPWPHYYRLRALELAILDQIHPLPKVVRWLELGCGNGFVATCLSPLAEEVVAADLPAVDAKAHAVGLPVASRLIAASSVQNVTFVGLTGEMLPFADESFEAVSCFYTLQYVAAKDAMVAEIARVLAPGGTLFIVVPNVVERVFALPAFWNYLWRRWRVIRSGEPDPLHAYSVCGARSQDEKRPRGIRGWYCAVKERYPSFPWPGPHGAYASSWEELMAHRPRAWKALLGRHGLMVEEQFPTTVLWRGITDIFSDSLGIYERLAPWIVRNARRPLMSFVGDNLCLVATKPAVASAVSHEREHATSRATR
jgi:SAM-dependent methyltransferase